MIQLLIIASLATAAILVLSFVERYKAKRMDEQLNAIREKTEGVLRHTRKALEDTKEIDESGIMLRTMGNFHDGKVYKEGDVVIMNDRVYYKIHGVWQEWCSSNLIDIRNGNTNDNRSSINSARSLPHRL